MELADSLDYKAGNLHLEVADPGLVAGFSEAGSSFVAVGPGAGLAVFEEVAGKADYKVGSQFVVVQCYGSNPGSCGCQLEGELRLGRVP